MLYLGNTIGKEDITYYEPKFPLNDVMRIFPTDVSITDSGGTTKTVGAITPWTDSRLAYCQRKRVIPFLSTKVDGWAAGIAYVRTQLLAMPDWILNDAGMFVMITDRHEPEGDLGTGVTGQNAYKSNFNAFYDMIKGLPANIRAKVRCGPILTKTWTESSASGKGNFDYSLYDPGVGDWFGVDMYVPTGTSSAVVTPSTLPTPATFAATFKAYKHDAADTRPRWWPELGVIGMPDDTDGSARATWLQGLYDMVKTWKVGQSGWTMPWSFEGFIWWGQEGAATGAVATVGQRRDFPLDERTTSTTTVVKLVPPKPLDKFNALIAAQRTAEPRPAAGGGTPPPADPPPPPAYTGAGAYWLGATMKKADIPTYEPMLKGNQMFRIFPNSDGLPPAWTDPRFAYAQRVGAVPFCSSNIDGDSTKFAAMRTWIINMPSWVKWLYVSDRHEPENNVKDGLTREKYLANFKAWWDNCIATLPANIRAKVKAGPILTRQWIEDPNKGNGDYGLYDPMKQLGLKTDFYATDHYMDSWKPGSSANATLVADAYPDPATFLAKFKAYKAPTVGSVVDDRERLFAEWGAIGIPTDPDGSRRAAWITGILAQLDTWTKATNGWAFRGLCWWNNQGTTSPTSLTPIGTLRFFYLDKWQQDTSGAIALPGNPPAPVAAYNQAVLAHIAAQSGGGPGDPPPDPPPPTGGQTDPPPPGPGTGSGGTDPIPGGSVDTSDVPVDTPAAASLLAATYTILVTDPQLNITGDPISEWSYLQITLRWKEPGSGQFKVPAFPYIREQLVPGCRIVVLRRVLGVQSVLISGPMEQKIREWSDTGENAGVGQYTVTFSDDMSWLAARVAYPNPALAIEAQTTDFWVYSGNPELGMLQLVRDQAGENALPARKVPKLVTAAFSGISGTGTVALGPTTDVSPRERLETLTDVLRKMATTGVGDGFQADSLGFRTRQTQVGGQDVILFEVVRSRDLAGQVHFSRGMGNLKYYSLEEDAPTLTHVNVGGQYNKDDASAGSDKYVKEFVDTETDSLAWGRYEGYLARPGSDVSAGKANDDAVNEFDDKRATARLAISAADTVDCRAMIHYGVGDLVSVELDIGDFQIAPVQTVSIQAYPTSGEVVGVTIGDQSARTDSKWIKQMRLMERRVGVLERRGAATPP